MKLFGGPARLRLYGSAGIYLRAVAEMLSGRWRRGDDVAAAEGAVARRVGSKHAVMMPMARVGIHLALTLAIRPGQKVVLSPYTISDVVNMVIAAGGRPHFVDIEQATCNISPDGVRAALETEDDIGAVLVTHFYGRMCAVEEIARLCEPHGVPMIEDAAQAFAASKAGRAAGTFGKAGIYSFGLYKNINCFYGGMVVTDDDALAASLRDHVAKYDLVPRSFLAARVVKGAITQLATWWPVFRWLTFNVFRYGMLKDVEVINNQVRIDVDPVMTRQVPASYLHRPSPLQARLLLAQMPKVDRDTDRRRAVADEYRRHLSDIAELSVPPATPEGEHIYWYFPIQYADRLRLVKHAMREGCDVAPSYHRNCADMPCFAEYARDCPTARAVAESVIYLPTYPGYGLRHARRNIGAVRDFFAARPSGSAAE